MNENEFVVLFRPVGQKELALVRASGWTRFPPRLHWRPIFYPVLTEEYAIRIARDWNTSDPNSDYAGFVLRFKVRKEYLDRHSPHAVAGKACQEYWIPAEEMDEFNVNLIGLIEVIHEFRKQDALPERSALEAPD